MSIVEIKHFSVWRPVPGFHGYEVSDAGAVRSMLAAGFGRIPETPRTLKATLDGHGYRRVYLRRNGRTHSLKVSWLVLEAFVGPRPDKADACHNDGDRENDALSNLRWDSRKNNLADCVVHGTRPKGESMGTSVLNEPDVRAIRVALVNGESQSSIAREFGVSQSTISKIKRGTRWGWLS